MKRIIHTIALAAPLATVALSLGATPAMAEPAGPASDQISSTKLGPVNPHLPEDPQEKIPTDEDPIPDPEIPDEKVELPEPCPTHGSCGDTPDEERDPDDGDDDGDDDSDDFEKPKRIDAGSASSDSGLELAWLIAGGGLITATGAAYAVRRREDTQGA